MNKASFSEIEVRFDFLLGDKYKSIKDTFDPADSSLQGTVEDRRDEMLDELNDDLEDSDLDEWEEDGFEVVDHDTDFADPGEFSDLDDYGEYAELVEEFGEAFHLRYEDVGEITKGDFEDAYRGCWESFEDYAQQYVDDCMDLDETALRYFDYEKFARDLSMDYCEYDGDEGTHVFSNY
jgi:antirestriction protein